MDIIGGAKGDGVSRPRRGQKRRLKSEPRPARHWRDANAAAFEQLMAVQSKTNKLLTEWAQIEHRLSKTVPGFFKLAPEVRSALDDRGSSLAKIDQALDGILAEREALLRSLPRLRANTFPAILAKVSVAKSLVDPEDHPQAHALLSGLLIDLRRFGRSAHCRKIHCELT